MKLLIFKDAEIDYEGVTPVWRWECMHWECVHQTATHGVALFWENAVRAANHHVQWHQQRRSSTKG